jgi:hypothetical protein
MSVDSVDAAFKRLGSVSGILMRLSWASFRIAAQGCLDEP